MHLNCLLLAEKYAKHLFKDGLRILEVGPDGVPSSLRKKYFKESMQWDTIDIFPDEKFTYVATNEYSFPIENDSYDIVVSANVIEHVKKIWRWMPELARVTKKGGHVITINPVSWNYHAYPVDCWRIYPDGMQSLYEDSGLEVEVSVFENLESEHLLHKKYNEFKLWPGATLASGNMRIKKLKYMLGYPVTAALDTITVGKKI